MPFTAHQFFEVFEKYNRFVFPMQAILILAACAAVLPAIRRGRDCDRLSAGILAFLWFWAGIVYHLLFLTEINPAAYFFGAIFVVQGFLFFYEGGLKKRLNFRFEPNLDGFLGAAFILYALIFYPLVGSVFGRAYPASPTFGAPCPTVIYTFGLLLWADRKLARYLLMIPVLWAFIGTSAATSFGVTEDFGLLAAGTIGTAFILRRAFAPEAAKLL